MKVDPRFKKGLELFDHGDYFECHEVIEGLWLETPAEDPYRDLYKGVIQAAAAIYQFDRGILSGALGLFESSTEYLRKYEPRTLGLEVDKLVDALGRCFEPLRARDRASKVSLNKLAVPKLCYNFEK